MALLVMLITVLGLYGVPPSLGACPDAMAFAQGRCYQVKKESVSATEAFHNCVRDKGFIAKKPFHELLTSGNDLQDLHLQDNYCYWMHKVYLTDYAKSIESSSSLFWYLAVVNRCPVTCRNGEDFPIDGVFCKEKRFYICEYEESVFQPKIPSSASSSTVVVTRVSKSDLILGSPLFTTRAAAATMCSRICLKSEGCAFFNFNMAIRECRGFTWKESVSYSEDPDWEVWVVKKA